MTIEERKACDRLLDFAYMKHKELEELNRYGVEGNNA